MFLQSKINYKTKPVLASYPSKISVIKLVKSEPPATTDKSVIPYLKPVWRFQTQTVNMQEQIDLQKSALISPEYVLKTGEVLDTSNVQYNQLNTSSLNAADKIQLSKDLAQMHIHNQAVQLANADIQKIQQQQTANSIDPKDLKIKQLQTEIETLKKGVK